MIIKDYIPTLRSTKFPVRKKMKKLGTLKFGTVEATPVVWEGRLMNFEWVRSSTWGHNGREIGYYHFVDIETNEETAAFAEAHAFGCAYLEDGVMWVHGVRGKDGGTNAIDYFYSTDLENWQSGEALLLPKDLNVYNTSVCKCPDGYIMAIEVDGENKLVGEKYTIIFAKSGDLKNWELLDTDEHIYSPEKYTACPSIRYYDGYFYMVYLESAPYDRWIPYIVRTPDLITFEPGVVNPFMFFSDEDRILIHPERFTEEERELVATAMDCNNSDVDFCDYNGKTVILYSWGNQLGVEFLAMAEYDGSLEELLKSFFV